jgi:hypothetical protein
VKAARDRGQLMVVDADECLPRYMRTSMPDSSIFLRPCRGRHRTSPNGGRYQKVRWWGEMVNILWERGDAAASVSPEDQFDQLAKKHDVGTFCSFLMDNFNGEFTPKSCPGLARITLTLFPLRTMIDWSAP